MKTKIRILIVSLCSMAGIFGETYTLPAGVTQAGDISASFSSANGFLMHAAGVFLNVADGNAYTANGIWLGTVLGSTVANTVTVANGSKLTLSQFILGNYANSKSQIYVDSGTLTAGFAMVGGRLAGTTGSLSVNNGTFSGTNLHLGGDAVTVQSSSGYVTLTNSTLSVTNVNAGFGASGSLGIIMATGSTLSMTNLNIAVGTTAQGGVALTNSTLTGNLLTIASGVNSNGSLYMSGGSYILNSGLRVGAGTNSSGSLTLVDASIKASFLQMGRNEYGKNLISLGGTGSLVIETGAADAVVIGNAVNNTNTFSMATNSTAAFKVPFVHISGTDNTTSFALKNNASLTMSYKSTANAPTDGNLRVGNGVRSITDVSMADNAVMDVQYNTAFWGFGVNSTVSLTMEGASKLIMSSNSHFGYATDSNVTVELTSASSMIGNAIMLGSGNNSNTTMNIADDASATATSHFYIANTNTTGYGAVATVNVTGGKLEVLTNNLGVGAGTASTGVLNVSDGEVIVKNAILTAMRHANASGSISKGVITISGGSVVAAGLYMSQGTNSSTTMDLSGTGMLTVTNNAVIAQAIGSSAEVTISGTGSMSTGNVIFSQNQSASSSLVMTGGEYAINGTLAAATGINSTNYVGIDGGSMTGAGNMEVAKGSGSITIWNVSDGLLSSDGDLLMAGGVNSSASLNVSGTGAISTSGVLYVGNAIGAKGKVSVTGGELKIGTWLTMGVQTNSQGLLEVTGGVVTVGNGITLVDTRRTGNTAALTVSGTGIVYADSLAVNKGGTFSGSLYVGAVAGTPASYAQVNSLALSSGAALKGTVNMDGGTTTWISLNGTSTGGADAITMDNLTILDGAKIVVDLSGFEITGETTVTVLTLTSGSGLEDADLSATGYDIMSWNVNIDWNAAKTALIATITIPEPSVAAALLGLLGLALVARRRR